MKRRFYALATGIMLVLTGCSKADVSPSPLADSVTQSANASSSAESDAAARAAATTQSARSATRVNIAMFIGQSNDNGLSPVTNIPATYSHPYSNVLSWDKTSNAAIPYQLGVSDHSITQLIVPSYDNGFGPDVAFVHEWDLANPRSTTPLFVFKKDLTPPVSTNGASIAAWLYGTYGNAPIYNGFYSERSAKY